jgi:hypothetical protein
MEQIWMCFGILGDDLGNGRTPWSVNMSLHDSNARAILRDIPVPRAYHGHLVLLREGPKRGHLRRWGWSEMAGGLGYAPCRLACGCGRDCRHDYQYSSSQATVVTKQRKKGGERERRYRATYTEANPKINAEAEAKAKIACAQPRAKVRNVFVGLPLDSSPPTQEG